MTHFNAETYDEVTDEELARGYDSFLDNNGLYDGLNIDGVELIPSEVLKSTDPVGYEDCLNIYINSLYDSGELMSEWDMEERIKELCEEWAIDVLGAVLDNTTTAEDKTIYSEIFKLYKSDVLVVEDGEIALDYQHSITEVLIAIGAALSKANEINND